MGIVSLGKVKKEVRRQRIQELLDRLWEIPAGNPKYSARRRYPSEMDEQQYAEWSKVLLQDIPNPDALIPGSVNVFLQWCEKNCKSDWMYNRKVLYFSDDAEAAHFLMVWK